MSCGGPVRASQGCASVCGFTVPVFSSDAEGASRLGWGQRTRRHEDGLYGGGRLTEEGRRVPQEGTRNYSCDGLRRGPLRKFPKLQPPRMDWKGDSGRTTGGLGACNAFNGGQSSTGDICKGFTEAAFPAPSTAPKWYFS